MTKLISIDGVEITQKNFQQVLIRGDGKDQFNQIINKEISIFPPSNNLEIVNKENYIFAKKNYLIYQLNMINLTFRINSYIYQMFLQSIFYFLFLPKALAVSSFFLLYSLLAEVFCQDEVDLNIQHNKKIFLFL